MGLNGGAGGVEPLFTAKVDQMIANRVIVYYFKEGSIPDFREIY